MIDFEDIKNSSVLAKLLIAAVPTSLQIYLLRRIIKYFNSVGARSLTRNKEKIEFIRKFLDDGIHSHDRIIVEHAFEIYLGKSISFDEIAKILSLSNPLELARRLVKSRAYIRFDRRNNEFCYDEKVATPAKFKMMELFQLGSYFAASFLAILLLVAKFLYMSTIPSLVVIVISSLFFILAYTALLDNLRLDGAKYFMKLYSGQVDIEGV